MIGVQNISLRCNLGERSRGFASTHAARMAVERLFMVVEANRSRTLTLKEFLAIAEAHLLEPISKLPTAVDPI